MLSAKKTTHGFAHPVTLAMHITQWLKRLSGAEAGGAMPADPLDATPSPLRSIADLETAPLQDAWAQLEAKRGSRPFLRRADIDPAELKPLLSSIGLVDVHHAPLRFRIRLAGTSWRQSLDFEATGLWLDDWPNPVQKQLLELVWSTTVTIRQAVRTRRHAIVEGLPLNYEVMTIPLAKDGRTIDMLLIMSSPWRSTASPMIASAPPG
jgi:hypothetical protein